MDKFQKEKIRNLRREGMSYAKIAKQVDVSRDAVIWPLLKSVWYNGLLKKQKVQYGCTFRIKKFSQAEVK